ncbi:hypothetical protein BDW02DRAFT_617793 [Decorospora gaudefroyi]|uniref:GPI anchored protein n=1 Tax=Decorospora gaudefroyi TaxID=184978 RepID=A0A6A5KJ32_9PLEO|nr:hypothetical protein BDW02DRAFT_617793 [Decorospora gaudefroyi]
MSKIFTTALFVSFAMAEFTTKVWMPGMGDSGMTFVGSVMDVSDDRTTLSISYQAADATLDELYSEAPQTVTLGGETYLEVLAMATESFEDTEVVVTVSMACSRKNTDEEEATCTMSTGGLEEALSAVCGPDTDSALCPDLGDLAIETTTTLPSGYFGTFPLVITAGEELLPSASAAATPSAGSASVTGSGSASASASPTASDSASGSESATGAESSSSTFSAGAPMMTMGPALAGLGAAAAAFFI